MCHHPLQASIDSLASIFTAFKEFFDEKQGQEGVSGSFWGGTTINIPVQTLGAMEEDKAQEFIKLCGEQLQAPMLRKLYMERLTAITGVNINHRWGPPEGIEISYKIEGSSAIERGLDPIRSLPDALNQALEEKLFSGYVVGSLRDKNPYFSLFITDKDLQRFLQNPGNEKTLEIFHHPRHKAEEYRRKGNFKARVAAFADAAFGAARPEHANYNFTRTGDLRSGFEKFSGQTYLRPFPNGVLPAPANNLD